MQQLRDSVRSKVDGMRAIICTTTTETMSWPNWHTRR